MKTKTMKVEDIVPAEYNPRVTLEPGSDEYVALTNSLDRFGLVQPLVINKTTGLLVSGHQRLNVLKEKGVEEVEVVLIEADPEQEKLLNIALNKIDSDWDYEKLGELFSELDDDDVKFTGFSEDEIENLFGAEEPEFDDGETTDEEVEKPESVTAQEEDKEFNVFVSFPTKDVAEAWLKKRGVETEYEGTSRNITIKMEGSSYGTGN